MKVKLQSYRGASAVEFAIILPILILLVFGIIEFSLALYDKAMITNASREGARAGIVAQIPRVTDTEI
jgi:Flp pilus assembly protein TadG